MLESTDGLEFHFLALHDTRPVLPPLLVMRTLLSMHVHRVTCRQP